jgi:uncharacterized protein (UPF0332 family)
MNFNWIRYIYLATELLKGSDESYYRSAISRAYYGVFCIARDRKGYSNYKRSDVHSKVITEYVKSNDEDERSVGFLLVELRNSRNQADYNSNKVIRKNEAERMVKAAKSILEILGILNDSTKE